MSRAFLLAVAALSLSACASTGADKAPVCDGKHLRPANPYGTVLASAPDPATPAAPAGANPKPSGGEKPVAATSGETFRSCGR